MTDVNKIQAAIVENAKPGVSSKDLNKLIVKAFPKASKKEIRLAAFGAMIAMVDQSPDAALAVQDMALTKSDPAPNGDQ